ncbi:MATE family efflux transporter [Candidatus Stoquefichus massiliensis]|uniref:MATE family efflux transporter n=1 Tax=Candidatus Stoquefichus massiliensis TaxID=1470350 RepID=UPI0004B129B4|nr:MATE family efflux transporter [Candidatus Stoquefichus massiliensis]
MKTKKQIDMLNGSIWDKLLLFALPLAASSILQQLFNAADVAVVGNFAGGEALAAVGANGSVINLLVNLFVGLSIGTNVVVASFIGQKDEKRTSQAVHTSILLSLVSGFVLLVVGILFARPILEFMSTPEDIIDLATLYLKIYFAGMPFIMLYNFTSAILRSKGDTKRPLLSLMVSGIINVVLNLFFVIVLHMSVEGVAIATVISNIISSLMLVYFLMHETDALKVEVKKLYMHQDILLKIAKIGVPAGLQSTVFSISNVIIQAALNALGSAAVAASAAALNFEYFTYFVISAFSQAAVTFIGQNYAASKYVRCKQITKWTFLLSSLSTLCVSFLFIVLHEFCIGFFTNDPQIANLAYTRMYIVLSFQIINMVIELISGFLRGIGYSSIPALVCVLGICGTRIVYIYTIYPTITSYQNLLIIYPISWIITALSLTFIYLFIHKKVYHVSKEAGC